VVRVHATLCQDTEPSTALPYSVEPVVFGSEGGVTITAPVPVDVPLGSRIVLSSMSVAGCAVLMSTVCALHCTALHALYVVSARKASCDHPCAL
jgi:hypothetical protein